jgi:hypothetical protein
MPAIIPFYNNVAIVIRVSKARWQMQATLSESGEFNGSELSLPLCSMPQAWETRCCRCHRSAPEYEAQQTSGCEANAGYRCLMCVNWYACLNCAEEEASKHRNMYPNEAHPVYCVTEDQENFLQIDLETPDFDNMYFIFESLVFPFLKMFIPCFSILIQVPSRCALCLFIALYVTVLRFMSLYCI